MINWFKSLDRVLKGEATRPTALRGGTIDLPVGGLTSVIVLLGAVYGACMGAFALISRWSDPTRAEGYKQMAGSAAKVPLLFLLTLLVTFPSLYVFNALVGSRLAFSAVLRLLVAALGVTMAVLASFGTIVIFFSFCTTSYSFIVLLNVAVFAIAGVLGMRFLLQTLQRLSISQSLNVEVPPATTPDPAPVAEPVEVELTLPHFVPGPPPLPPGALDRLEGQVLGKHVKTVFRIWVIVFGLVGAQMGWVLRPFIGNPSQPFTFFRDREGSFFEAVVERTTDVLYGNPKSHRNRGSGWRSGEVGPASTAPAGTATRRDTRD